VLTRAPCTSACKKALGAASCAVCYRDFSFQLSPISIGKKIMEGSRGRETTFFSVLVVSFHVYRSSWLAIAAVLVAYSSRSWEKCKCFRVYTCACTCRPI